MASLAGGMGAGFGLPLFLWLGLRIADDRDLACDGLASGDCDIEQSNQFLHARAKIDVGADLDLCRSDRSDRNNFRLERVSPMLLDSQDGVIAARPRRIAIDVGRVS